MFYLITHSTHFIYSYIALDSSKGPLSYMGRFLLYAPSQTGYHSLCYTSCGALVGTEIAQWVHHEGWI